MNKTQEAFSLPELLVAISIIGLLTLVVFPNWKAGERQFSLQRAAYEIAQDLREVQEKAMSSQELPGAPSTFQGGYGMELRTEASFSVLFADLNNDKLLNTGEEIERIELEKGTRIHQLSPGSPLAVVFLPPDPSVFFEPDADSVEIVLTNESQTKTITINKTGLISVE